MNKNSFRRFEFFDVDILSEHLPEKLGFNPTCVAAEGSILLFGDQSGHIVISDRNLSNLDVKHKIFRGEIKFLSYIYDPSNHNKQYIIALGDDALRAENEKYNLPLYFIKVCILLMMFYIIYAIINT